MAALRYHCVAIAGIFNSMAVASSEKVGGEQNDILH